MADSSAQKEKAPWLFIAILGIQGLFLVPAGLFLLAWNLRLVLRAEKAEATLVASERVSANARPLHTLEFLDPATGECVRRQTSRPIGARVGDAVPIFVSTDGRAQFALASVWELWLGPGIFLAFGLVSLFFACSLWAGRRFRGELGPPPTELPGDRANELA